MPFKNRTPEHCAWDSMIQRCRNKNHPSYPIYGGRGIAVCERWRSFKGLADDMGKRPSPKHSLERIDNNKGYEPSNCRWATRKEQQRNTRSNRPITFRGETKLLVEWAEELGYRPTLLHQRLSRGWGIERAFTELVEYHHVDKK